MHDGKVGGSFDSILLMCRLGLSLICGLMFIVQTLVRDVQHGVMQLIY